MRPLPPVAPDAVFRNTVRSPRDYYVRVQANDYSVDPAMSGRLMEVTTDLSTVTVSHDGVVVTTHERAWARQQTPTDPARIAKAAELRRQFQTLQRRPAKPALGETRDLAPLRSGVWAFGIALRLLSHHWWRSDE